MFNFKKVGVAAFISSALMASSMSAFAGADQIQVTVNGEVVETTCTISQKDGGVTIDLGKAPIAAFTDVGADVASNDVTLDFAGCADGISPVVSAQGTLAEGTENEYKNTAADNNVAVKLVSDETVLDAVGKNTVPVTIAEGVGSMPLKASMVKATDADVTAGKVQSVATLNVEYK